MARSEPISNTYEETPDELRELLESTQDYTNQVPTAKFDRSALLNEHEKSLKWLDGDSIPPQNFILPLPYLPSRSTLSQIIRVNLSNLRIDCREVNDAVLFRTIAEPYVYSSSITIVEDYNGDVARLTVCNIDDSMNDPMFPIGTILAVKQPCWSAVPSGGYHIRVDHPSDIVFLETTDDTVPSAWKNATSIHNSKVAISWKEEGDKMFLEKRFRKALTWYASRNISMIIRRG
jgi:hypothetical protein